MTKKVRNGLKKVVSIVMTSALIVGMTTVGTGGKMVADAAPTATNTRTWEFSKNEGKPMPVKGEILPDTDKGGPGILYPADSKDNVTFDPTLLKFRANSYLLLPIQDDTTMITYGQIANQALDRKTNVGIDTDKYQIGASTKEQKVTIPDITDMIQEVNGQKYIAIYSHGDVKVTKINLTEYNPINRVTVTGTIANAKANGIDKVYFLDTETNEVTSADINADNTYSVVLKRIEGSEAYIASVSKPGFKLDDTNDAHKFTLEGNEPTATYSASVVEAPTAKISGTVTGVPDSALKGDFGMQFVPEDVTMLPIDAKLTKVSDGNYTYEAVITPGANFKIALINANDYEVLGTINKAEGTHTENITATKKPVYKVTGNFVVSDSKTVPVSEVTFTNMNEEGYSYTFTPQGNSNTAELREGEYLTYVTADVYTAFDKVSVKKDAVTNDIYLDRTEPDVSKVPYKETLEVGKGKEFETIQSAVDYVARMEREEGQRVTLKLNDAIYREQIIIAAPYITFATDRTEAPLVTWYYGIGATYYSVNPTTGFYDKKYAVDKYEMTTVSKDWGTTVELLATATDFKAENITFEASFNRYMTEEEIADGVGLNPQTDKNKDIRNNLNVNVQLNKNKERACAMFPRADRMEFYQCSFLSSQDTIYTGDGSEHMYYKDCLIEGTTDFICGNGNVVFDNCTLSIYGYSDKTADGGYITASKEGGAHGYLFNNCKIVNTTYAGIKQGSKRIYLGRPWGAGTKVLYYNCEAATADLIHEAGWATMANVTPAQAYYSEYNLHTPDGTPVSTSKRASGTKVLTEDEAKAVSVESFFDGWKPLHFTSGEEPSVKYGDVNDDKKIDSSDAVLLKKRLAQMTGLVINEKACDVNANGTIDIQDAVILLQHLAGFDVGLDK